MNKPLEIDWLKWSNSTLKVRHTKYWETRSKIHLENNMTQQEFAEISGYTHKTDSHIMQDTFI